MARLIFVDTSFLYAGIVPEDAHHEAATALVDRVQGTRMVTTNHVRGESWSLMNRRKGHHWAKLLLDSISQTNRLAVVHLDAELEDNAINWLRVRDERGYSFVDATSFAFMRANGITEALAFDGDFAAAGFTELRA